MEVIKCSSCGKYVFNIDAEVCPFCKKSMAMLDKIFGNFDGKE